MSSWALDLLSSVLRKEKTLYSPKCNKDIFRDIVLECLLYHDSMKQKDVLETEIEIWIMKNLAGVAHFREIVCLLSNCV